MYKKVKILFFVGVLARICYGQQQQDIGPRELYYREQPDTDELPPVPKLRKLPSAHDAGKQPNSQTGKVATIIPAVRNLGIRYSVILVDHGKEEAVNADRMFRQGECFQLQLEANRSGYLYVLNQGSSGNWAPLLPSALMPDEANILKSLAKLRVPVKFCFEITDPPGTERLLVVLSRNPDDLYDLDKSMRKIENAPGLRPVSNPVLMSAQSSVDKEVARIEPELRNRDLKTKRISLPEEPSETRDLVYVVDASGSPVNRIVTEIRIKHQ